MLTRWVAWLSLLWWQGAGASDGVGSRRKNKATDPKRLLNPIPYRGQYRGIDNLNRVWAILYHNSSKEPPQNIGLVMI